MLRRSLGVLAVVCVVIAAVAMLWPMRAHHATWAVTVGAEQTNYVPVDGGKLVTPIQLLIGGTDPKETTTRSALRIRVLVGVASVAFALGAGITAVRSGRGHQ